MYIFIYTLWYVQSENWRKYVQIHLWRETKDPREQSVARCRAAGRSYMKFISISNFLAMISLHSMICTSNTKWSCCKLHCQIFFGLKHILCKIVLSNLPWCAWHVASSRTQQGPEKGDLILLWGLKVWSARARVALSVMFLLAEGLTPSDESDICRCIITPSLTTQPCQRPCPQGCRAAGPWLWIVLSSYIYDMYIYIYIDRYIYRYTYVYYRHICREREGWWRGAQGPCPLGRRAAGPWLFIYLCLYISLYIYIYI